jgi:signal transduction histidine kinase
MSPLRSVRNKLALLFFAITALSFAVVVFYVVPQLQTKLEHEELRDLELNAKDSVRALRDQTDSTISGPRLNSLVRSAADQADAFVTLLGPQFAGSSPERFYSVSDSRERRNIERNYEPAGEAVARRRLVTNIVPVTGHRFARTAVPLYSGGRLRWVAVYTRSLAGVTDTVSVVRNQVLVASAVALLLALLGGYLVAARLARRVRRVEGAAQQVAAGRFVDPLPVKSRDELGQLTHSFNEMQLKLQQLDRARRDFIANASHELRTPVFSLGGFVELLQDEELEPATREEFLDTMAEQVERLQKLAVDLLDLSRLDAGSLALEHEATDVTQIARAVAREFTPALARHRSELELDLPEDGVPARCDPDRVAQIMRILLDNALAHTPEGTNVTVTANHHNGAAELAVADSGPRSGGPALAGDTIERLFERFFTADGTGGSGLGLAIARELAERMDGRITVATPPGRTVFTLELPSGDGTA